MTMHKYNAIAIQTYVYYHILIPKPTDKTLLGVKLMKLCDIHVGLQKDIYYWTMGLNKIIELCDPSQE